MANEMDRLRERERQIESSESGHYGHAQQRATAPDGNQNGPGYHAEREAAESGQVVDNYLAEERQLDAKPPLPAQSEP